MGHAKGTYKRGVVWDTFAKQEQECVAFLREKILRVGKRLVTALHYSLSSYKSRPNLRNTQVCQILSLDILTSLLRLYRFSGVYCFFLTTLVFIVTLKSVVGPTLT